MLLLDLDKNTLEQLKNLSAYLKQFKEFKLFLQQTPNFYDTVKFCRNFSNNLQEYHQQQIQGLKQFQNFLKTYEKEIKEISEFLNEILDLAIFKKISRIYKVNDKEFVIILTDGVKIKTNKINDNNDRINKEKENKRYLIAEQLYFNMSKERKIDYIDLRFNDYIIFHLLSPKYFIM